MGLSSEFPWVRYPSQAVINFGSKWAKSLMVVIPELSLIKKEVNRDWLTL